LQQKHVFATLLHNFYISKKEKPSKPNRNHQQFTNLQRWMLEESWFWVEIFTHNSQKHITHTLSPALVPEKIESCKTFVINVKKS